MKSDASTTQVAWLFGLVLLLTAWQTLQAAPAKPDLKPTADTSVRSQTTLRKDFGKEPVLEVGNSPDLIIEACLRFDISSLDRGVRSIKLRLFAGTSKPIPATLILRNADNATWPEEGLAWKDKPGQVNAIGKLEVVGMLPSWYEVDLTAFVKAERAAGANTLSLVVVAGDANNKVVIASREAEANQPELAVLRGAFSVKVTYRPAQSPPPVGYLSDNGAAFGPQGNGFSYGWNIDCSKFARDRRAADQAVDKQARPPDARYAAFISMDHSDMARPGVWEMEIPNGKYKVHLVAGDAGFFDSIYAISVENVLLVDGVPDTTKRWVESSQTVAVEDGRLTISNHARGINNKICFVEIAEVSE